VNFYRSKLKSIHTSYFYVYPSKLKIILSDFFSTSIWDKLQKLFILCKVVVKIVWSKWKLKCFYSSSWNSPVWNWIKIRLSSWFMRTVEDDHAVRHISYTWPHHDRPTHTQNRSTLLRSRNVTPAEFETSSFNGIDSALALLVVICCFIGSEQTCNSAKCSHQSTVCGTEISRLVQTIVGDYVMIVLFVFEGTLCPLFLLYASGRPICLSLLNCRITDYVLFSAADL
jgi:hypothetical protein